MGAFSSTFIIIGLVFLGGALGWRRPFQNETAVRGIFLSLVLLMVLMGFSTSRLPNIGIKWSVLGVTAFWGALIALIGTWIVHFIVGLLRHNTGPSEPIEEVAGHTREKPCLVCVFKVPLVLMGFSGLGFVLGSLTPIFPGAKVDIAVNLVLFVLVFLVGYEFGFARRNLVQLFFRWDNILLPALTIIGTLASAFFLPALTGWKLSESLALVSGMGWYSLSSVLITGFGNPLLGSSAFLANLLREMISLVLIPVFIRLKLVNLAIASPGAASMDVALPLIEKFAGVDAVPTALAHGLILSFLVPSLVIFWMGLGF